MILSPKNSVKKCNIRKHNEERHHFTEKKIAFTFLHMYIYEFKSF